MTPCAATTQQAKALFQKAQAQAKERYRYLKRLEALYAPEAD